GGTVRRVRDGRRRRTDGPGGRGPARALEGAGALRRQIPAAAQEGGAPHARPAHARAQEVRPARRSPEIPVLEAVVSAARVMVRVAVGGASGYMGADLPPLLSLHPKIPPPAVTSH